MMAPKSFTPTAIGFFRHAAPLLVCLVAIQVFAPVAATQSVNQTDSSELQKKREERRQFQLQEMITARSGGWVIKSTEVPRIVWRDPDEVRRLGGDPQLRIRWFDAQRNENPAPVTTGRWIAWIEGTAPNGYPLRRAFTFYSLPKELPPSYSPDLSIIFPQFPDPKTPTVIVEHQAELLRLANDLLLRTLIETEQGAILFAGLGEAKPLGRPARFVESTAALNDSAHLALKLKLQGLESRVRTLKPPRHRVEPATILHPGSLADAGMKDDAKRDIDNVCRAWADDSQEPFVTLVARHGVIITHEAFGKNAKGAEISRDYRCWVASITKTVTALLFSRFVDQNLVGLDDSVATVFPDFPQGDSRVPTFRQCFNHTSGLSGFGELGTMRHPHLENVVLNAIDVNTPNAKYEYSGLGFELAAKAMELVAGTCAVKLYDEHLFRPLGMNDVPMGNASSDGEFTAWELGVLAQWIANQGSYGELEFISPQTFEKLLPQPLTAPDRGFVVDEGIGLHWIRIRNSKSAPEAKGSESLLFSERTLGHGSFSGCILVIDPVQQLIIAQVRKNSGLRHGEWSQRFYEAIAAAIDDE